MIPEEIDVIIFYEIIDEDTYLYQTTIGELFKYPST